MVAELCAGVKQVYKLVPRLMGGLRRRQWARGSLDEGAPWLKLTPDDAAQRHKRLAFACGIGKTLVPQPTRL